MKNKKKMIKNKIKLMFPVAIFPILMFLVLGPIEVYYGNIAEFDFLITDFIWGFIGLAAVVLVFSLVIAIIIPNKILNILICAIVSFSITSYIQNLFLNSILSSKNGTQIDWSKLSKLLIYNAVIWIFLVLSLISLLIFMYKKYGVHVICNISLAFAIIQMITITSCIIGIIGYKKEIQHYQLSGENQFCVSQGNNIVVIILDATPSELFNDVYMKDSSIADGLKDFTYYNNYDSLYCPTFPSVLHMLTGEEPNIKNTRMEYAKKAWNSDEAEDFYGILHDKGYKCNLYSNRQTYTYGMIEYLQGKIDNLEHIESKTNYKLMYPMMLKYSLFKYSPYCLKERFEVIESHYQGVVYYTLQDEITEPNADFYSKLTNEKLTINNNWGNALIVEHIEGCHANRKDEKKLYEGIKICNEYINQLKELNLYNNATIIILADHGDYENKEMWQPIFFIKEQGANHDKLQVNSSPISSNDFLPTIAYLLGEDLSKYGTTIYDWKEGQERERTTWFMDKSSEGGLFGYTYYKDGDDIKKKGDYEIKYYSPEW